MRNILVLIIYLTTINNSENINFMEFVLIIIFGLIGINPNERAGVLSFKVISSKPFFDFSIQDNGTLIHPMSKANKDKIEDPIEIGKEQLLLIGMVVQNRRIILNTK